MSKVISVIVPVYNAESYLNKCVDSILNQTYQDFEVLLIDDGSMDGSGYICDRYAEIDHRVRAIHQGNSGVSATRNVGIYEAKGDYFAFVDSDDYIEPDMLEQMDATAKKNNSDIVMCEYYIDKSGVITPITLSYQSAYITKQEVKNGLLYRYYTDDHAGLYCLWNKIIRREIVVRNDISFDTTLKRGEDAWFIFQSLKDCIRVDFLTKPLYFYCQNESSVMHKVYDDQYEKWVEMRKRLLFENKKLLFGIDYGIFFREFQSKVLIHCRELLKREQYKKAFHILFDDFYMNTLPYETHLPLHMRLINKAIQTKQRVVLFMLLYMWSLSK